MRYVVLLLTALALASCAGQHGALESLRPVCEALGKPLKYNPNSNKGGWFAGKNLASAIDERDQTGANLSCPGY